MQDLVAFGILYLAYKSPLCLNDPPIPGDLSYYSPEAQVWSVRVRGLRMRLEAASIILPDAEKCWLRKFSKDATVKEDWQPSPCLSHSPTANILGLDLSDFSELN